MRKALLFAPMLLLCLALCACGEREGQQTRDVQQRCRSSALITADVALTCRYSDEVRTYTLACRYTPERAEITVTDPPDVSGITAVFDGATMSLRYEDVLLDAGSCSGTAISPLWAAPALLRAVAEGYPLEYCRESAGGAERLRVTFELSEDSGCDTLYTAWFDDDDAVVRGEISVDGAVIYEMSFTNFTAEEQTDGTATEEDLGGDRS